MTKHTRHPRFTDPDRPQTTTGRDTTQPNRLVRGGLLSGTYMATLLVSAALALGGAVHVNALVALPVAGQLAIWMMAVAGLAAAPVVARVVTGRLDDLLADTRLLQAPVGGVDSLDDSPRADQIIEPGKQVGRP